MQLASARPYNPVQGVDYFGYGTGGTSEQAVLLNTDPNNYLATSKYTAAQVTACLAAGNCHIAGYDSARGTPFFQLDARFSKAFSFKERMKLEFFFQAFNMTNRANFGGNYYNNIRTATFGDPGWIHYALERDYSAVFTGEAGFTFRF